MPDIVVIAHNIRSAHNIGALLRTADGLGVQSLYFTGYTPYPHHDHDTRLPHLAEKIDRQISKTALGAEKTVPWQYHENIQDTITQLKDAGYTIAALEQSQQSIALPDFTCPEKLALLLGSEVTGVAAELLEQIPIHIEIPMRGNKESFNVIQAAAMALYHCTYINP